MLKIKKPTLSTVILIILGIFTCYSYFKSLTVNNYNIDNLTIFTFVIMLFITIIGITKDKRPFSLNKTYWYFNLIFFIMAPLAQYLENYHVWGVELTSDTYSLTNALIILGNIVHLIFYKNDNEVNFEKETENNKSILSYIFLLTIALMSFALLVMNVGFNNLFLRATNVTEFSDNKMFNTIITSFLKALPVYCFTIAFKNNPKLDLKNCLLILIVFLMNYPVSTTRFWMGAIFIGIILLVFIKNKKQNRVQDIILMLTFTIIFPITYLFHFYSLDYVLQNGMNSFDLATSYLSVDYDAYSIFGRIINYTNENGIVFGKQLIGTLLFMIPRAVWPSKPQATGAFLATVTNQNFTNISSPFVSEGYINFGILGLVVFEFLLAIVSKKLDNNYWSKNKNKYVALVYPYLIGLLLFYERGALHHAVVYTFCFMLPLLIMIIIDTFSNRKNNKHLYNGGKNDSN